VLVLDQRGAPPVADAEADERDARVAVVGRGEDLVSVGREGARIEQLCMDGHTMMKLDKKYLGKA